MSKKDFNINLGISSLFPHFGFITGVVCTLVLTGSIFSWIYLLAMGDGKTSVLIMEAIVNLIILAGNVFLICRIGYNDFGEEFKITYGVEVFFTLIGLYFCNLHLLVPPVKDVALLYGFLEFLVYVAISFLLSVLPSLIISIIIWIVMAIFGKRK